MDGWVDGWMDGWMDPSAVKFKGGIPVDHSCPLPESQVALSSSWNKTHDGTKPTDGTKPKNKR
jgi:hypothetical protein